MDDLARSGRRFERQVNEALSQNPEVAQYVKQLESAQADEDDPTPADDLPDDDDTESGGELPKALSRCRGQIPLNAFDPHSWLRVPGGWPNGTAVP